MEYENIKNVIIPGSKSYAHRALLLSLFLSHDLKIDNLPDSNDIKETKNLVTLLKTKSKNISLFINESASTLRMGFPFLLLMCDHFTVKLGDSLIKRPLDNLKELCDEVNATYSLKNNIIEVDSSHVTFKDTIEIDGSVTSQILSGLLMVLPSLDKKETIINIKNKLVSLDYVRITLDILKAFGIEVLFSPKQIIIKGNQEYNCDSYYVEGDYSSAASLICYACYKKPLILKGLKQISFQPDSKILTILYLNKVEYKFISADELLINPHPLTTFFYNVEKSIDLGPTLFIMASLASKECILENVNRLEVKESSRLSLMIEGLKHFNVAIEKTASYCIIKPSNICYDNKVVETGNDHRIIMAFLTLGKILGIDVKLSSTDGLNKSFPLFQEILEEVE